jgi:glycosyltransferase involved in cell wall biosynthesis
MFFGEDGLFGGGERYPLELARAMARRVETRLVTFGPRARRFRIDRLEVSVLPMRMRWQGDEINPLSERLPYELARTRVIHAHHYKSIVTNLCLVVGRALGKRVYCTDLGGSARHYADQLRLSRLVNGFLAISEFSARCFPSMQRRASVIHGGVDVDRFHPIDGVRERSVVFVGRILPHKGIDVLIRAVDETIPVHVYGRPYDPTYLAALARLARGKAVHFHFEATDDEVLAAYRRASVAVLPSVPSTPYGPSSPSAELLGLVLLEAMACGTPVIGSRLGGIPEVVVEGVTGHLVEPGSVAELRERLEAVLGADPASWRRMSAAAAERVRGEFTWDRVAERCLAAYRP